MQVEHILLPSAEAACLAVSGDQVAAGPCALIPNQLGKDCCITACTSHIASVRHHLQKHITNRLSHIARVYQYLQNT